MAQSICHFYLSGERKPFYHYKHISDNGQHPLSYPAYLQSSINTIDHTKYPMSQQSAAVSQTGVHSDPFPALLLEVPEYIRSSCRNHRSNRQVLQTMEPVSSPLYPYDKPYKLFQDQIASP